MIVSRCLTGKEGRPGSPFSLRVGPGQAAQWIPSHGSLDGEARAVKRGRGRMLSDKSFKIKDDKLTWDHLLPQHVFFQTSGKKTPNKYTIKCLFYYSLSTNFTNS